VRSRVGACKYVDAVHKLRRYYLLQMCLDR
jgi:hypothetical protein